MCNLPRVEASYIYRNSLGQLQLNSATRCADSPLAKDIRRIRTCPAKVHIIRQDPDRDVGTQFGECVTDSSQATRTIWSYLSLVLSAYRGESPNVY